MKFLLINLTTFLVALLVITQIIIPAIIPNLEFWWAFKSKPKSTIKDNSDFIEKVNKAKEEVTELRNSAHSNYEEAKDLKDKVNTI